MRQVHESWRINRTAVTWAYREQSNAQLEAQIGQRGKNYFMYELTMSQQVKELAAKPDHLSCHMQRAEKDVGCPTFLRHHSFGTRPLTVPGAR